MKKNNGFTLIELMITVMIMGILTSIAMPMYQNYVLRAKATEGISALGNIRVKLEQYFQDNRTYVDACDNTGIDIDSINNGLKHFELTCVELLDTSYIIQAEAATEGLTYTLNQSNQKATTAAPSGWSTSADCWIINENNSCQ